MELRDYQSAAIERLRGNFACGHRRQILVAPTGAGKTVMASSIIRSAVERGRRCLFLAHRKELIDQASGKLDFCEIEHGVIKAGHKRRRPWCSVQVASVQTLVRRNHFEADVVIIDECHRSTAATYQKILERFEKPPTVIGLTATPYRQGGAGLADAYEKIVVSQSAKELVLEGFLVNPKVYAASQIDISRLRVKKSGEFTDQSAADAMADIMLRGEIVDNWKRRANGASTVCFAVNVEHSKQIVKQFQNAGIPAAHLDGKTPDAVREEILRKLASRELKVVSNVGVLCEGYDLPLLECVILARPIHSRGLWKQCVGRVMRTSHEKRMAVVMDHGCNTQRHGFVTDEETYTLEDGVEVTVGSDDPTPQEQQFVICENCGVFITEDVDACPECGHVVEREVVSAETVEELVEVENAITPTILTLPNMEQEESAAPKSKKQKAYEAMCMKCVLNKYKPGWVAYAFKEKFNHWPSGVKRPEWFNQYVETRKRESEHPNGPDTSARSANGQDISRSAGMR